MGAELEAVRHLSEICIYDLSGHGDKSIPGWELAELAEEETIDKGAEEEGDESDEDTKRKAVKPSQVLHLESHELIVLRRSRIFLES